MDNYLNIWGAGAILAFSGLDGKTDFKNDLVLRIKFNGGGLITKSPNNDGEINFKNEGTITGDFFTTPAVKGAIIDTHHLLMEGNVKITAGNTYKILQQGNRTLFGIAEYFNPHLIHSDLDFIITQRKNFLKSLPQPKGINEESKATLLKAYSMLKTQIYSPEGQLSYRWTTPDRWPHKQMWLWDSVFHSAGIRHIDINLAREAIKSVLQTANEDGFIPLCANPYNKDEKTQPPILALGVALLDQIKKSDSFIAESYHALSGYLKWDLKNRTNKKCGLLEWYVGKDKFCRSGESGMDNSPRFDSALQIGATDFNSFFAMECGFMAKFATRVGKTEDAAYWKSENARMNQLLNKYCWDEELGIYCDYNPETKKRTGIKSSSGFLPLLSGAPSQEQVQKLVEHLHNPKTFGTPFPIPSVTRDTQGYNKDMWRGPVWINVNYLIILGLERYEQFDEAQRIREITLKNIEKYYHRYGVFFEFFDDQNELDPNKLPRKGKNIPDTFFQSFHDYGWTGMLYIEMLFSNSERHILWK
ncbi:MAG: trehalase family glycosidase [Lentisphaeria bacterium]